MAKVTSKLQLTIPKAIADLYVIRPGDELEWTPAGDAIRVTPASSRRRRQQSLTKGVRLRLFDRATERQQQREMCPEEISEIAERRWKRHEIERGWRREDLHDRGRTR